MKWERVTVDSVAKIVTKGTTPTSIGLDFVQQGIPFLRVNNIKDGKLQCDDILFIDQETDKALSRSRIQPQDVLLSIAGTIGRSAVVPADAPQMNCNQAVAIVRLSEKIDPHYFRYWLDTHDASKQITGSKVTATISNLSLGCIKELLVPLPPIAEQRRIAAILDRADAVRRKRQEAIALTEELLRSAFLEMFGDPIINSKAWDVIPISDIASKDKYAIVDGPFGASLKQEEYVEQGVPVIRINNIKPLTFHAEDFKFITEQKFDELKRSAVKKNDILMARVGHTVGKACIFDQDYPALLSTTGVAKITCDPSRIYPVFCVHQLNLPQYQRYVTAHVSGAGQPYLNLTKIKSFQLVVPPISEQRRFVQLAISQENIKLQMLESQFAEINLFNSLLQKAFRGEL